MSARPPLADPSDLPQGPTPDGRSDAERDASAPHGGHHGPDPAVLRRLKSVEGHVRGVQRMVEEGAYCMDVLHQIQATERALAKVRALVLDRHLHTCVTDALREGGPEDRERVIDEIMVAFRSDARP